MRPLSTKETAQRLGVTTTTIKRWADSGFLRCERTAGQHRRFSEEEVARISRARAGGDTALDRWVDRLLGDADRALHAALLFEHERLGAWWRVADELGPVLHELGLRWEEGRICVLEEHRASARLSRALARVCERLPVRRGTPRALLAAAEHDDHTLGLSLVELCLREGGWRPSWYGARAPADELAAAVRRGEAEAVALSASAASRADALALEARLVGEAARDAGVLLVVGGRGPWPDPLPFGERLSRFGELHAWMQARAGEAQPGSAWH
jgi:excisionase family DNA binding protein